MITHVFICNNCKGEIEERTFERAYASYKEAESEPAPECPRCASSNVTRFFGHNIFCNNSRLALPIRYVPYAPEHKKGIVSIGMSVSEEQQQDIDSDIEDMMNDGKIEVVRFDSQEDFTETALGLRRGTLDYALFEVRQKKLIDELRAGKPISGFFMPVSDENGN